MTDGFTITSADMERARANSIRVPNRIFAEKGEAKTPVVRLPFSRFNFSRARNWLDSGDIRYWRRIWDSRLEREYCKDLSTSIYGLTYNKIPYVAEPAPPDPFHFIFFSSSVWASTFSSVQIIWTVLLINFDSCRQYFLQGWLSVAPVSTMCNSQWCHVNYSKFAGSQLL